MDAIREAEIVRTLFKPALRDRYLALLTKPRRRRDALGELDHGCPIDAKYLQRVPDDADAGAIEVLLVSRGAPHDCYAISAEVGLDGRVLPLKDALAMTVGRQRGTILSCVAGTLAYFEMEDRGERFIVERPRDER
jgi:hypothetical protein